MKRFYFYLFVALIAGVWNLERPYAASVEEISSYATQKLSQFTDDDSHLTNQIRTAVEKLLNPSMPQLKSASLVKFSQFHMPVNRRALEAIPSIQQNSPEAKFASEVARTDSRLWVNSFLMANSISSSLRALNGNRNGIEMRIDSEFKDATALLNDSPFSRDIVFLKNYTNLLTRYGANSKPVSDELHGNCVALGSSTFGGSCCSGVLIGPRLVLAVAHCSNCVQRVIVGSEASTGRSYEIKWPLVVHPDFRVLSLGPDSEGYADDLMLIELVESIAVTPMKLPDEADDLDLSCGWIVGYGKITDNPESIVGNGTRRRGGPLAFGDPSILDYGAFKETEIVTGPGNYALDPCKGDSGGPILVKNRSNIDVLFGLVSRGVMFSKAECGVGTVYVRVDRYLNWIRSVAKERGLELAE